MVIDRLVVGNGNLVIVLHPRVAVIVEVDGIGVVGLMIDECMIAYKVVIIVVGRLEGQLWLK